MDACEDELIIALNPGNFLVRTRFEVFNDFLDEELDEILRDLKVFTVARHGQLRGLLEAVVGPGRSDRRIAARRMPEVVEMEAAKRGPDSCPFDDEQRRESDVGSARVQPPPPRGGRWPTRRTSTLARAGGTKSMQEILAEEREAIACRIVLEVLALGFENGEGLTKKALNTRMLHMSGGARASTLKKKLFRWKSVRAWFQRVKGLSWPARVEDVVEYLEARAGELCGKPCVTTFLSGFSIMEKLGQVPVELRFSSNDLVKGAVAELTRNLRSTGVIQAPFLPLILVCVWEKVVVDRWRPTLVRVTAWVRSLKYWASMIFDDLVWLDPDSVLMSEAGLEATMSQSKTSNKLTKADALKIFVSTAAFFSEKTWLMEGKKFGVAFALVRCSCFLCHVPTLSP